MVGLSVVLEAQKGSKKTPQVINKTTMLSSNKHSSSSSSSAAAAVSSSSSVSHHHHHQHSLFQEAKFLDQCFLCRKRLLPGKDIYMYKGDRAFCSVECRCKQIFMDEEESVIDIQKAENKCCFTTSSSSSATH